MKPGGVLWSTIEYIDIVLDGWVADSSMEGESGGTVVATTVFAGSDSAIET